MVYRKIEPYLKTFLFTFVIVFITVVFVVSVEVQNTVFENRKSLTFDKDEDEIALMGKSYNYLEDKYLYLQKNDPSNYKINIILGKIYELQENWDEAEKQYAGAIEKSNSLAFEPIFSLARVYLIKGEQDKANNVVKKLNDSGGYDFKVQKAKYYEFYGDIFLKKEKYEEAIAQYKTALKVYDVYGLMKPPEGLLTSLVRAYHLQADEAVANGDYKRAVYFLHQAVITLDDAVSYYKLGLLYLDLDKQKSLKYFDIAFRKNPSIINYEIYESLIQEMIQLAAKKHDVIAMRNYREKIKLIERFKGVNLLEKSDISVKLRDNKITFVQNKKNSKIKLDIEMQNNKKLPIKSLYMVFKVKNDVAVVSTYETKVVTAPDMLLKGEVHVVGVEVPVPEPFFISSAKNPRLEVFASKNPKLKPVFIAEYAIPK